MIKLIFEKTYTQYHCIQKLNALQEYLGKISDSDDKFMKMLVFKKNGPAIYNISDILISQNIADKNAEDESKVNIVYTGDEKSSAMSMKKFADLCRKILDQMKDFDDEKVILESVLDGENKGYSFRFYYDDSKDFAILVRNTNVAGIEQFLNSYEGDLKNAIELPKTQSIKSPKKKNPNKQPKERRELVSAYDEFGHKIKLWRIEQIEEEPKEETATSNED